MNADEVLARFATAADAQRVAVAALTGLERRAMTERPGQYALDLVADAAVLEVLHDSPLRVLSEESGWSGPPDAPVTVVVDPVDGSTNCSRRIPYWGISLAALDADGLLCALVENSATGERFEAVRDAGAFADALPIAPGTTTDLGDALVGVAGLPRPLPWAQFRALGSAALSLCDVAAGRLDGYLDVLGDQHAPWDFLGGVLVCREAGAVIVDRQGRDLAVSEPNTRRQLLAAATPALLEQLRSGAR